MYIDRTEHVPKYLRHKQLRRWCNIYLLLQNPHFVI